MGRIGILGGTFDPPHIGHLILAQEAMVKLDLEKIGFIPLLFPLTRALRPGPPPNRG